jgi:2-hydroxy-6-oxonona-2,4-dienedioate hydrolase
MAGEGLPVVLVHGLGVSGRYMLPLAESLAERCSVYAPDLPGYGHSQKPPAPLAISELASALAGCLDALGLERPAFVANSMGCQVVTELAVRFPERAGPLVLIGATVDPKLRLARRQLLGGLRESAREPLSLLALAAYDNSRMGVRALLATMRSALADRIEQRLPLIEQPTLVLRGEKDGFVSAEWAEQVAALLPRARLVVVPREPHAVHYTRPDLVAALVTGLLFQEGEQAANELLRGLPHRYVSAREKYEPGVPQGVLPLPGDPRRHQPVSLAPNDERRSSNRAELGSEVTFRNEHCSPQEPERPGAHSVRNDRRQLRSHVVERLEQPQDPAKQPTRGRDPSRSDQSEAPDAFWLIGSQLGCYEAAKRMTHEVDTLELRRLKPAAEPGGQACDSEFTSQPGEVRQVDEATLCKRLTHQRPPTPGA